MTTRPLAWLTAALTLPMLTGLALAACGDDNAGVKQTEQSYEVAEPVRTLALDAKFAEVTVETGDGPVTVKEIYRFSGSTPTTSHQLEGDTLRLTATGCTGDVNLRCDVEYQIRVPKTTAAQLTTEAGRVTVRGLDGPLTVTTNAGEVQAEELTADEATVTTKAGVVNLAFTDAPTQVQVQTEAGADPRPEQRLTRG